MPEPSGAPRGGALVPAGGALMLPPDRRLAVPVLSGCGGVGRTTVAALLAAVLHRRTVAAPDDTRGSAVLDCAARGNTPWPAWVTAAAGSGTGALAGHRGGDGAPTGLAQLTETAVSYLDLAAPAPLWVYTDTGPATASFLGAHPGPRWWLPLLSGLRLAVVDGDALEGARLAAQTVGGPLSVIGSWFATPFLNTAAVWVTDSGEASLRRTIDALTCMAEVRMPMDRVVVAVTDRRAVRRRGGHSLAESWYELIAPRAGALVDLGHDRALADQGGCPPLDAVALDRAPLVELARAVAQAARLRWIPEGEPAVFDPVSAAPGPGAGISEMLLRQAGRAAFR